jgi:hypothetical protein
MRAVVWLLLHAGLLAFGGGMVGILGGALVLFWRFLIFLGKGVWIPSICDFTTLFLRKFDVRFCEIDTALPGLNIIARHFLNDMDASWALAASGLACFVVAVAFFVSAIAASRSAGM